MREFNVGVVDESEKKRSFSVMLAGRHVDYIKYCLENDPELSASRVVRNAMDEYMENHPVAAVKVLDLDDWS